MKYTEKFKIAKKIAEQRLDSLLQDGQESGRTATPVEETEHRHIRPHILKRLLNGESFSNRLEFEQGIDRDVSRRKIERKIERKKRQYRRIWSSASIAAAIACGFIVNMLIDHGKISAPSNLDGEGAQIELILANGEHVTLSGIREELLPEGFDITTGIADKSTLIYNQPNIKDSSKDTSFITLKVPKKEDYIIELPDGTTVYINSCSSLRFPEQFQSNSRDVYLTGEAAFDVRKNERAPFRVHTAERTIIVTGTKFNVRAYADEPVWQTTLIEGGVQIAKGDETLSMHPLQCYTLHRADGNEILEDIPEKEAVFAPWTTGVIHFENATLEDIEQRLQKWYDFSFAYENEYLKTLRFTASVSKKEQPGEFFRLLEKTAGVRFAKDGKRIIVCKRN